jgi:hypothetical protein
MWTTFNYAGTCVGMFELERMEHVSLSILENEEDIQRVIELEDLSYPLDEKADEQKIRFRQQNARHFFQIAMKKEILIGFINGTLINTEEMEEESMSSHDPNGTKLCIHSVVSHIYILLMSYW